MKTRSTIYFNDEKIYLKNEKTKKIIIEKINNNIIKNGKINNIEKFIKMYENLIKKYKLNNNIFGETIKIIVNPTYNSADTMLLKSIFEKFNYRKIIIENETKYYKINNCNSFLNINNSYKILSMLDEYKKIKTYLIPNGYFEENDEFEFIKKKIENKDIYLLGEGKKLEEFFQIFEKKYKNKTYLFNNNETYLLDING